MANAEATPLTALAAVAEQQTPAAPDSLEQLANILKTLVPTPPKLYPTFGGQPHESLDAFLKAFSEVAEDARVAVAAKQLVGEAATWYSARATLVPDWVEFVFQLEDEYNTSSTLGRLTADFYGRRQELRDPVDLFLAKKVALAKRVAPALKDGDLVAVLKELIHPRIRRHLRTADGLTLDRLRRFAKEIEDDFRDNWTAEKTTPSAGRPARAGNASGAGVNH